MTNSPRIIPELDVTSLSLSLEFYTSVLGFRVLYDRPEERFAMIDLDGARLMLEEAAGPGRRFTTARLERPFGRGVNFQIEVENARGLYARVVKSESPVLIPLETRWYRVGLSEQGNEQFVVGDPDGYLLRFFTDLGSRPVSSG
ncbi:catechol 2,3-dioxygenase-like lactoylglutathione lyase family enzyme [Azorhizobium sp. AG788]|uniref:bleomycin resistance protein n=1 Tax=Azorhizobium sp. AG788 TaxID=2183897 RepID=UPI00106085B1|nr:VOC family protein [Azorhizobium sp. AG788]TDT96891.1 catechol 2,3-dioxygenase-like lactoylglutathione lyase family enzyme [Azorhizobium sp. AG788]